MTSSKNSDSGLVGDLAVAALIIPISLIGYVISIPAIALGCAVDLYLQARESHFSAAGQLGEATNPGRP